MVKKLIFWEEKYATKYDHGELHTILKLVPKKLKILKTQLSLVKRFQVITVAFIINLMSLSHNNISKEDIRTQKD